MFLLRITQALADADIDYALVGGYAVALHGAVRGTVDIDIVIRQRREDYIGVEQALIDVGLQSRLPVSAADVFNFRKEYVTKRNLLAWSFYNPSNPAELVDVIINEDLGNFKTSTIRIQGERVVIISRDDLIALKEKSGRPQDLEDVRALRRISKGK